MSAGLVGKIGGWLGLACVGLVTLGSSCVGTLHINQISVIMALGAVCGIVSLPCLAGAGLMKLTKRKRI